MSPTRGSGIAPVTWHGRYLFPLARVVCTCSSGVRSDLSTGSFEKGDEAKVLVSSDGSNWTSVHTFTVADSDNTYQFYDISLSNSGLSSNFWVAFDANMNSKGDWWSVDDVWIGIP